MGLIQSLWQKLPPKLRQFFENEPETVFLSSQPPEALLKCIRESLKTNSAWNEDAVRGRVNGNKIDVRWKCAWLRDGFEPLFRGRVEAADGGSRIVGCMTHDPHGQAFMAVWCGAIVLASVLMVWTVFVPLGGWVMLWLANGFLGMGESLCPDRRGRILEHLRACAAAGGVDGAACARAQGSTSADEGGKAVVSE